MPPIRPPTNCAFCGGKAGSPEHVFPKWIGKVSKKHFSKAMRVVAPQGKWISSTYDITTDRVCHTCNTGWMSRLEAHTQPILTPMLLLEPVSLSFGDRRTLAAWAYKTAIVADLLQPAAYVPNGAYPAFYQDRMPPNDGVAIWTTGLGPGPSGFLKPAKIVGGWTEDERKSLPNDAEFWLVTFSVLRAVFQVFGVTRSPWFAPKDSIGRLQLLRIWPTGTAESVSWPPGKTAMHANDLDSLCYRDDF